MTAGTWAVALVAALVTGSTMSDGWTTMARAWHRPPVAAAAAVLDPIFARPVEFFLFTLPVWQALAAWATTLAVIVCLAAVLVLMVTEGEQVLTLRRIPRGTAGPFGPLSFATAAILLVTAVRVYLSRFDRLFAEHTVFSGVTYTDAHIVLPACCWWPSRWWWGP